MPSVQLPWNERTDEVPQGQTIASSEYEIPDPDTLGLTRTVLIDISAYHREDDPDTSTRPFRLIIRYANRDGHRATLYPSVEAAKQAAEEIITQLVTTENAAPD